MYRIATHGSSMIYIVIKMRTELSIAVFFVAFEFCFSMLKNNSIFSDQDLCISENLILSFSISDELDGRNNGSDMEMEWVPMAGN